MIVSTILIYSFTAGYINDLNASYKTSSYGFKY